MAHTNTKHKPTTSNHTSQYFDTTSFFEERHFILQTISAAISTKLSDQHVRNVSVIMGSVDVSQGYHGGCLVHPF